MDPAYIQFHWHRVKNWNCSKQLIQTIDIAIDTNRRYCRGVCWRRDRYRWQCSWCSLGTWGRSTTCHSTEAGDEFCWSLDTWCTCPTWRENLPAPTACTLPLSMHIHSTNVSMYVCGQILLEFGYLMHMPDMTRKLTSTDSMHTAIIYAHAQAQTYLCMSALSMHLRGHTMTLKMQKETKNAVHSPENFWNQNQSAWWLKGANLGAHNLQ